MTSEEWLGNITPPDPTRMRGVADAMADINTAGAELDTASIPWCSATQKRRKPSASATRAVSIVWARASALLMPS